MKRFITYKVLTCIYYFEITMFMAQSKSQIFPTDISLLSYTERKLMPQNIIIVEVSNDVAQINEHMFLHLICWVLSTRIDWYNCNSIDFVLKPNKVIWGLELFTRSISTSQMKSTPKWMVRWTSSNHEFWCVTHIDYNFTLFRLCFLICSIIQKRITQT